MKHIYIFIELCNSTPEQGKLEPYFQKLSKLFTNFLHIFDNNLSSSFPIIRHGIFDPKYTMPIDHGTFWVFIPPALYISTEFCRKFVLNWP